MTNQPPAGVAAMLALLRPSAEEIVVAADSTLDPVTLGPLADAADRLVRYEFAPPPDRANAWLVAECNSRWVLRIDGDEVPSPALVDSLPELVETEELTHYWVPRRWLWPSADRYLARWPWRTDYQPRLFRNDPALIRTPGRMHTQTLVHGPSRHLEEPLYHLDCLVNGEEQRVRKARAYERVRPGMRQAGMSMNTALYLPERHTDPATEPVPDGDRDAIRGVLAAVPPPAAAPEPAPRLATRAEIDRHWEDRRVPASAGSARIELLDHDPALVAGEHRGLDVRVDNLGDETWPWGTDRRPEIRLSYHWRRPDGSPVPEEGFRTPFPAPVRPGGSVRLWAGVTAPQQPGRYVLELDLVNEGVRWFGCVSRVELQVTPRRQVAIIGGYNPYRHVGDDAILAAHLRELAEHAPDLEPLVCGPWPDQLGARIGYPTAQSAHLYLLRGLQGGDPRRITYPVLLARTVTLVRAARAIGAGNEPTRLAPAGVDLLRELQVSDALLCLGAGALTSNYRLELWAQAATILAASALGVPVAVSGVTVGPFNDPADRAVVALALRRADLITVRDRTLSPRQLSRLGVPRRRVRSAWDPASALEPAPAAEVDEALARAGIPGDAPFAAVSLHPGPAFPGCLEALAAAVDVLGERHGLGSVFVPMSLHPDENDNWPADELRGRLRDPDRLRVLEPLPADDVLLGLVGRARLAVGTRYHLAVFAATGGVPAVGIYGDGYTERKLRGLAELARGRLTLVPHDGPPDELVAAAERLLDLPAGAPRREGPLPAVEWLCSGAYRSATSA